MESQQSIRTVSLMISIFVLTIAFFVFTPKLFSNKAEPVKKLTTAAVAPDDHRIPADVFVVKAETITDELQTTGTIAANQEVDLVSEVARKLTRIYAREGSYVTQGTLLFKLDDADLLAKKKKIALQEKLARLDEKRFRELLATEAVNQQEYDQIATNLSVLQAEMAIVDVELAKTEIRAPFSGRLGLNKVDVGAYVTPSTVLTALDDVSRVEVAFTVPEKYASAVRIGQTIQFTTENSNQPFRGSVVATEPKTDLNTRSLLVKAISENRNGKLVPGSSAKIAFTLRTSTDGILIPTQALIPNAKGYSSFALKNGKAEQRELKTGSRSKGTVQILEGLSLGDTVLTTNLLRLEPGVAVRAANVN
ncbi:membrane fusion protein (multidrug efflux system) [Larkinella arboricola]|uniref:Membrane fusion protein (Multidrug efflux system) n=1 Tax=Larkinella arboricola TaxID=643671 RepID=A0A327WXS9_LARAB|nr:efflux RND transporter periplasmic adaptor subunit [Larkinella arboricola]RAJ97971.1 membrane fusion protein (multidrug efflux system) [Larkinella arboricola]